MDSGVWGVTWGSLLGGSGDLVMGITMFIMWVMGVTNLLTKSL